MVTDTLAPAAPLNKEAQIEAIKNAEYGVARAITTDDIPVIDIAPLVSGENIEDVAAQILDAVTHKGFFYIANHGIPQQVMDKAGAAMRDFFAKPQDIKSEIPVNTSQRGWLAPGMVTLEGNKTHDLKEIFFWGPEQWTEELDQKRAELPLIADNLWPDSSTPELRSDLIPYYDAANAVGHKILSAVAIALGLEKDFFAKRYQTPLSRGQLVYYPVSTQQDEADERYGSAPHTDYGVLTLLLQDMNGGLEVLTKDNEWVTAVPIPGTLVCNVGDLLHRWSNDRFSSNLHRVINRSGNERHSIAIFFDPTPDAVINPRDMGLKDTDEVRYEPVITADYINAQNKKSFAQYNNGDDK
ncbi:isopenicillin N synthase family dioxygenase [Photobacterium minamisatsumaniensis]|uniref:isopenicillin N synthase family dioxygenase n=1 Tax=Photobacterium minamisatsumaniensis TaxID=2910233 RepID=UPI003D0D13C2